MDQQAGPNLSIGIQMGQSATAANQGIGEPCSLADIVIRFKIPDQNCPDDMMNED